MFWSYAFDPTPWIPYLINLFCKIFIYIERFDLAGSICNKWSLCDLITNQLYLKDVLEFGESNNEVGVEATTAWIKRNLIILNNINKVANSEDRVLLIIGQAHRAIIKEYINNRNDMEYIEISDYLLDKN